MERATELRPKTAAEIWLDAIREAGGEVSGLPPDWKGLTPAQLRVAAKVTYPSRFAPIPALYRTKSMMETLSARELRALIRSSGLDAVNRVLAQTPAEEREAARGEL